MLSLYTVFVLAPNRNFPSYEAQHPIVALMSNNQIPDKPKVISDPSKHTMGDSLLRYVQARVHHLIDEVQFDSLRVHGSYDRSAVISRKEKQDKLENWQHPTASFESGRLTLHCFPGRSYVYHYASMTATYLALSGRDPSEVRMELPDREDAFVTLLGCGMKNLPKAEIAVVAAGNKHLAPPRVEWEDEGSFKWRSARICDSRVTWIAIKHSFWGDIAFHLGGILSRHGFSRVMFFGKLGSLNPDHVPNTVLATGSTSTIGGRAVSWENPFTGGNGIVEGRHITLPSVVQETNEWLHDVGCSYDFVDPEIGHFAAGVVKNDAQFGYLHIVSDNVAKKFREDLSNEREHGIPKKRQLLYKRIRTTLEDHLS